MSFLSRLNPFRARTKTARPNLYPFQGAGWVGFGGNWRRGVNQFLSDWERVTSSFGWVRRAVVQKADDLSALAVTVEVRRGKDWIATPDHPLAQLMRQPNPWISWNDFCHIWSQHMDLLGKAAWLVIEDAKGLPLELHALYPFRLCPEPDPIHYINRWRYNALNGQVQYYADFGGKPDPSGLEVLYSRVPDPTNPYSGDSTVQAAGASIGLDAEIRSYAKFYFAQNATPGLVMETDQPYPGPEVARAMAEDWNQNYQGAVNAGKTARLWGGFRLKSTAPAFKDLEFAALSNASKIDIFAHFGVPLSVVGDNSKGSLGGQAADAERLTYQRHTLEPARRRLELHLNRLAARYGQDVRVVVESAIDEAIEQKQEEMHWRYMNGIISRSEYREWAGEEPDGQPDVYLIPGTSVVVHSFESEESPKPKAQPISAKIEFPALEASKEGDEPPVVSSPTPGPDEPTKARKRRFRAQFASEYQRLKARGLDRPDEILEAQFAAEWEALGLGLAPVASKLRNFALAKSDRVTAFEALKSDGVKVLLALEANHG
jgi:HK97 family phage portal protein